MDEIKSPDFKLNYSKTNIGYRCNFYPHDIDATSNYFLNLYYDIASTRDSNGNISYPMLLEYKKMYNLNDDDFILLNDIVKIGQNEYAKKVNAEMQKKANQAK